MLQLANGTGIRRPAQV